MFAEPPIAAEKRTSRDFRPVPLSVDGRMDTHMLHSRHTRQEIAFKPTAPMDNPSGAHLDPVVEAARTS
jgi:hypothetical protein